MARTCTICNHSFCNEINQAIVNGQTHRAIARRFAVSKAAIQRHAKNHIPKHLAKAVNAKEIQDADSIVDSIIHLETSTRRIQESAETHKDFKIALAAIREQSRLLELKARLLGELRPQESSRATVNQIENVNIRALLLDPNSRKALELLSSKAGGCDGI
jgi:hypothetical protein